jgi:uncharacterized protein YecE (DUF72 family)
MGTVRIGTSGWTYRSWEGVFYPDGLRRRSQLGFLAQHLDAVEVNATFYRLQATPTFQRWRAQVPSDFRFTVKGSRYITHMLRLRDPEPALARFFASGLLDLGGQLSAVLWQLPPDLAFDAALLTRFLHLLPRTVHHVLEPRHPSFAGDHALGLLRSCECGLVIADSPAFPRMPELEVAPRYVRLHGGRQLYRSRYSTAELRTWAQLVRQWARTGDDVYVFFDNDAAGHAPVDAMRLRRLVALNPRSKGRGQ